MASVGDSWKMIAYLLPVLLAVMGCLKLLQRFQARTGRLPAALASASRTTGGKARGRQNRGSSGIWNALVGGFHLNNARKAGGSSIRLLESVPIGGANVHLLEVRGRVLLLGASAAGLNLLAEFEAGESASSNDFRDLLHAAAADMDALDYEQDDLPATAAVSTLEDLMRETGQSVGNNARRLRTVREVDIDD